MHVHSCWLLFKSKQEQYQLKNGSISQTEHCVNKASSTKSVTPFKNRRHFILARFYMGKHFQPDPQASTSTAENSTDLN